VSRKDLFQKYNIS